MITSFFGSPERARRRTRALTVAACICVPGVVLGTIVAARIWRQQQTPSSTRWGWSVVAALLFLYIAPMVTWRWPGQLLNGASFGSVIGCTIVEVLGGPLALQIFTWLLTPIASPVDPEHTVPEEPPAATSVVEHAHEGTPPSPPHTALVPGTPTRDPRPLLRLGADAVGRIVDIDMRNEASVFVVGLPGTGKTTTLIRLIAESLRSGWCVIAVDLKGSGSMNRAIHTVADRAAAPLYTVDRSDPHTYGYNTCSGDPAQVANKLVGSFDFTGVANVYQQVALDAVSKVAAAVQARDQAVTLGAIVAALQTDEMMKLGREAAAATKPVLKDSPAYVDYVAQMTALSKATEKTRVLQEGLVGIQKRLASLDGGTFGTLLRHAPALEWETILAVPSLSYISLPTLASPADVELLGRVIIQDVKQLADRRLRASGSYPRCLLIIDEFGALNEPTQIIDLILQGREADITTVASTQFLPKTPALLHALLGAGVVLAHRVASPDAEVLASQFGTVSRVDVTSSVDYQTGEVTRGTVRRGQTYAITPDQFRNLSPGHVALRVAREVPALRHRIVRISPEEIER